LDTLLARTALPRALARSCEAARKKVTTHLASILIYAWADRAVAAGEKSAPTLIESTYLFGSKCVLLRIRRGEGIRARVKGKPDIRFNTLQERERERESLVVYISMALTPSLRLEHEA